jgi:hypothetical protein
MELAITDLKAVLKARVSTFCRNKKLEDENDIRAGIKDVENVLTDMKRYADELESTKEELRNEEKDDA